MIESLDSSYQSYGKLVFVLSNRIESDRAFSFLFYWYSESEDTSDYDTWWKKVKDYLFENIRRINRWDRNRKREKWIHAIHEKKIVYGCWAAVIGCWDFA